MSSSNKLYKHVFPNFHCRFLLLYYKEGGNSYLYMQVFYRAEITKLRRGKNYEKNN